MKDQIIREIEQSMLSYLDNAQMKQLHAALEHAFFNKTVSQGDAEEGAEEDSNDLVLLDMFLAAKRVEGCSEKTIRYYKTTLTKMLTALDHQIVHITTDDLRNYLALYQQETECSKSNIDNIRRILSSFFSWLEDENYVLKSPVRRIHKIRTSKPVKETYTDEALEIMRDSCENLRDLAIIDLLASTGMRVGEMVNLNIVDVDFENRECIVLGKGSKERPVYFDARTKIHLHNYITLINTVEFKDIVGNDLYRRLNFIRMVGNNSAHSNRAITPEQAQIALENLFYFMDFIAYCYADEYQEQKFNAALLKQEQPAPVADSKPDLDVDIKKLIAENQALKEELTKKRQEQAQTYVPKPLDISEFKTRKVYIDTMLIDAGWVLGKNWYNEYELPGMPNKSEVGYVDYALFTDDGKPLAIIEAKRTCKDVAVGRQQAKLYADLMEKRFGRRPIIFLTNGFDTRIWNDQYYPEHQVSGIYSQRDLEKEFNKLTMRTRLNNVRVNDDISGRYYQKEAVKAVCRAFDTENRRKALLVMATGSGKTRTTISIVDVLLRHGWVKNILFLADRNSLVTQAKRAFVNMLPTGSPSTKSTAASATPSPPPASSPSCVRTVSSPPAIRPCTISSWPPPW